MGRSRDKGDGLVFVCCKGERGSRLFVPVISSLIFPRGLLLHGGCDARGGGRGKRGVKGSIDAQQAWHARFYFFRLGGRDIGS